MKGDYGFNGSISGSGIGTRRVRISKINQSTEITTSTSEQSRNRRAYYPVRVIDSDFSVDVDFIGYNEAENFRQWLSNFYHAIADNSAKSAFLTIRCPNRKFFRYAVPTGEIAFGEGVTDTKVTLTISFTGAPDPANLNLGAKRAGVSFFRNSSDADVATFYPQGNQVAGQGSADSMYDTVPVDAALSASAVLAATLGVPALMIPPIVAQPGGD